MHSDLEDGFSAFSTAEISKLQAELGAKESDVRDWEKIKNFIESNFVDIALQELSKHAVASDLELARSYLNWKGRIRAGAVEIIRNFGDESDVDLLAEAAEKSHGQVAEDAAEAAIELSKDNWDLFGRFLSGGNSGICKIAVRKLKESPGLADLEELEKLLLDESAIVRMSAVEVVVSLLDDKKILELLERYAESIYYYDVSTYLDKALYAPKAWQVV